jgi:hypothetical protein
MFGNSRDFVIVFTGVRVLIESMFNAFHCGDLVITQFSLIPYLPKHMDHLHHARCYATLYNPL